MKILISNDDGVFAPGIKILAETLRSIGEIDVVAPDRDASAASNSLTLTRPLRITHQENGFVAVEGTPTDCVHLALTCLLDHRPDIVVAGINDGANLGDDVLYSGTVAAAMEGRYLGLPALAISLVGDKVSHYQTAALVTKTILLRLIEHPLPNDTILNVNVPDLPIDQLNGYEVTRLGKRHAAEGFKRTLDPRGKVIYWLGSRGLEADGGLGTDFFAVKEGRVSITPIQLDLTHYQVFDSIAEWVGDLNAS
jgi:5'-nucleotidase